MYSALFLADKSKLQVVVAVFCLDTIESNKKIKADLKFPAAFIAWPLSPTAPHDFTPAKSAQALCPLFQ